MRFHGRVKLSAVKSIFNHALLNKQGFGLSAKKATKLAKFTWKWENCELKHGTFVIFAITACTNTSNLDEMLAVVLVARNVIKKELKVESYFQTSMSPWSQVVSCYFEEAGVQKYLDEFGFTTAWYGCIARNRNSFELPDEVTNALKEREAIYAAFLSGNRNFEGVVHLLNQVSFFTSPPLCAANALVDSKKWSVRLVLLVT